MTCGRCMNNRSWDAIEVAGKARVHMSAKY
jgi:hypothetical protein